MSCQQSTLDNGLRVVTEKLDYLGSVSLGFWIQVGTKEEQAQYPGISHFIEHLLFKGTKNRSALEIVEAIESVGGHINAFTDKEYACFYAKVLKEHLDLALEVLSDILLNSLLDPQSIEIEKNVILQEIKRHEDTPEELIHDLFAQTIWAGHLLGKTSLGTPEIIQSLNRDLILRQMEKCYTPDNIIVAAAGNLDHHSLLRSVQKFSHQFRGTKELATDSAPYVTARTRIVPRETEEVHLCLGTKGYSQSHDDRYVLAIIDSVLGEGMSSRLFKEIRELRGLAYAISTYSITYKNAGLFVVYAGTSLENLFEVLKLVKRELESIKNQGITDKELSNAKERIKGVLVLGLESTDARMVRLARSLMYLDRIVPLEEIVERISKVSRQDVLQVANEIFTNDLLNVVVLGPLEENYEGRIKEIVYS